MNGAFLNKILAVKREKVERQKRETDLDELKARAVAVCQDSVPRRLKTALSKTDRTNIIAEIKRASPSKGLINDQIDVAAVARQYEKGGAAAISVLTEEDFFKGSLNDLIAAGKAVDLPILRKDFIVDEFQIYESAAAGADAILLIVAALDEQRLRDYLAIARNSLGMDVIVEIHTADELATAERIGADIIGVNNRDLRSFDVSLDVSRRLIELRQTDAIFISESGISTREEIEELSDLGFYSFLIGETLMRTGDPIHTVAELIGANND